MKSAPPNQERIKYARQGLYKGSARWFGYVDHFPWVNGINPRHIFGLRVEEHDFVGRREERHISEM
eukprot:13974234-Ditylum_brightwellii.AAC.1